MIRRKGSRYTYDIGTATDLMSRPSNIEEAGILPDQVRNKLELHIIVPGRIDYAKHNYADRFRGRIPAAIIEGDGRNYTCFYRSNDETRSFALVDIPTTIRVMEDAVDRRMRHKNIAHETHEWREVENQEIERFSLVLQMFINRHEFNPDFAQRVKIFRYDPVTPGDLLWLHNILFS